MSAPSEDVPQAGAAPGVLRGLWDQFGTLALALGIALGVRACVVEPFRIPSGSMFPTLLIGDHLFVNKFLYGPRIPFTDVRLPGLREPQRGDVVVFEVARAPGASGIFPADQRPDLPRESFVKRVIGLPGDVVVVEGPNLSINGEPMAEEPTGETFTDDSGITSVVLRETLPDGASHLVLDNPGRAGINGRFVVDEGRYLMMGDNRDDSNDGRMWGTVRLAEFKGPAFLLYWSWDFKGSWLSMLNPITWVDLLLHKTRWSRIGSGID